MIFVCQFKLNCLQFFLISIKFIIIGNSTCLTFRLLNFLNLCLLLLVISMLHRLVLALLVGHAHLLPQLPVFVINRPVLGIRLNFGIHRIRSWFDLRRRNFLCLGLINELDEASDRRVDYRRALQRWGVLLHRLTRELSTGWIEEVCTARACVVKIWIDQTRVVNSTCSEIQIILILNGWEALGDGWAIHHSNKIVHICLLLVTHAKVHHVSRAKHACTLVLA